MNPKTARSRVLGTVALAAAFGLVALTALTDSASPNALLFAALLLVVGTGLRLEAAVLDRRQRDAQD